MRPCPNCRRELPEIYRFCTQCGASLDGPVIPRSAKPAWSAEALNLQVLYVMVAVFVLALLFPPWETPPTQAPEFLGLHFILAPPTPDAVVSRLLMTIELVTIAIAGLYGAFLFRQR
jgi:zinc ribbon protein